MARFLDDGLLCLGNKAAERALRGIALGRRNWTFAGSDQGGRRSAAIYTLMVSNGATDAIQSFLAQRRSMAADRIAPAN